ncbi:MAG: hypothetical protein ACREFT_08880, partial [Acetobacteraceae bacterium]
MVKDAIYMTGMAVIIGLLVVDTHSHLTSPALDPPSHSYAEQWAKYRLTQAKLGCQDSIAGLKHANAMMAASDAALGIKRPASVYA